MPRRRLNRRSVLNRLAVECTTSLTWKQIEQAKAQAQDLTKNFTSYEADAERKLEQARKETGSKLTKAVDDFDRTVEATASKAKSSMFGWFGNSK